MADLKAGTTVAGAAIWNASNLQVIPAGNFLTYRGFKVYTSGDKPTATDLGFLPAAGGAMTGVLTSNSDIITTKVIEGNQLRSNYRGGIYRDTTPYFDFIRTDIITADALPATNQTTGMLRFNEGSKTSDIHGGLVRGQLNHSIQTDGNSQFIIDNRDSTGAVKNRIRMYSSDGSTRVDVGSFVAGTTTLGTTTTGALTASSATVNGTLTATGSLNLPSPNAGIELGSSTTAGTPFIDFNTKGKNVDYDMRILANQTELLITTPGVNHGLRMPFVDKLSLHSTLASAIIMCRGATVLRDFGNGNVTLSGSKKSDSDTVGGDLYLGYTSAGTGAFTNKVRLESEMNWKGTNSLVDANGKLVGASLDTAYLPLTGGSVSGSITLGGYLNMVRAGTQQFNLVNSNIDVATELPTSTTNLGSIIFREKNASGALRGCIETAVTTTGGAYLQSYVRDSTNKSVVVARLESDTATFNITTGNFRVGGTSTLVGAVTVNSSLTATTSMYINGTGNKHLWFGTGTGTGDKGLIYADDNYNINMRSGQGGTEGVANIQSRSLVVNGNIWANKNSHGYADQWKQQAPLHVDFGTVPGSSDYYPIVRGVSTVTGYGWTTQVDLGVLREGNGKDGVGVLRVGSGESAQPSSMFTFSTGGIFTAPNSIITPGIALNGQGNGLGNGSIALGDGDTGLKWHSDGVFSLQSNGVQVAVLDTNGFRTEGGRTLVTHGDLNQASDSYSTYVRDIYVRSDIRVKTDLHKFENASQTLSRMNGYLYKQKKGELENGEINWVQSAGLIAQEVQETLPELISVDKDNPEGLLRLNYNGIIALNTAAINEHTKEIDDLKKQINELKSLVKLLTK